MHCGGQLVEREQAFFAAPTSPKPEIGRDLIVARAASVKLPANGARHLAEARLDVHVHVFLLAIPEELAALDLTLDLL